MRTTLDLDDALLVRAKVAAAQQRTTLTRLIEEGLALRLDQEPDAPAEPREPFRLRVFGDPNAPKMTYEEYKARVAAMDDEWAMQQAGLLPFRDPDDPDE
jgi:hypothetical protein